MGFEAFIVNEKQTYEYAWEGTGALKDQDGNLISNVNLLEAKLTLCLFDDPTIKINGRDNQDILGGAGGTGANNVTFNTQGVMKWKIQALDNIIQNDKNQVERHIALFYVKTNSSPPVEFRKEVHFFVTNLPTLT